MSHSRNRPKRLLLAALPAVLFALTADAAPPPVCTYNDAVTSFGGSTYPNNQQTSTAAVACTAGSPTTAGRLNNTSYARTVITPPNTGDFKFLQKNTTANSTPPAFEMVAGMGQETQAFPDPVAVPIIAGLAAPGCDDTIAGGTGGINAIERHLNRTWPLFGTTYYYGDFNTNPPNDPATVTTPLSPYGKWAPYDPNKDYIYFDVQGKWGPAQGVGTNPPGTAAVYPKQVTGYPDGCSSAGLTAAEVTKCRACITSNGYYLHDGVVTGDLAKSVFHGNILNDYPPAWVHFSWAFGYILNFQLKDAANNPIFPMARDTAQTSNGGNACTTSSIQHTGGSFEPVGSADCSIAYPTYNWTAVQALGLTPVYNDQANVQGGGSAWGSDGAAASPAGDILAAGNWVDAFVSGNASPSCKFCQTKSVLYLGFGQPCGETRPAGLPAQTMAPCTGECAYVNPACTCAGAGNFIAEAAAYLYNSKNVRSYFIGMGPHTGAMRRGAAEGHGKYFDGRDTKSFHDAFFAILSDLIGVAASSATSTVNAVQVSVAGQQELVPRFVARQQQGIWEGHLFKFFLFSEFAADCTTSGQLVKVPNAAQPVCTAKCVCPGGQCTARWLVDSNAGTCNLITPDSSGFLYEATWNGSALVLPAPTACTSNAQCGGKQCNLITGKCPPNAPAAVPVWDANALLQTVNWYQRTVYTAIDTNGDGAINASDGDGTSPAGMYKITTSATAGAADLSGGVTDAVADALAPYMAIDGTTTCTNIEAALGITLPAATPRLRACARVILNYALGEDLFNEQQLLTTDANYLVSNRISMMGDVFHSSPQDIGPPVSEDDCVKDTRRCVNTLFNTKKANRFDAISWQALDKPDKVFDPVTMTTVTNPGTVDAYDAYYKNETFGLKRPHASVYGANDGMVHAIQTSCYVNATTNALGVVVPNYWDGSGTGSCIAGSKTNGGELWAFIAPDLLPKLGQLLLGKHQFFVDNSPMVRDIYSPAGTASPLKRYTVSGAPVLDFKRIAIFGEREGGTHWFGLDVTDPTAPQFRWLFPQPNTEEELAVGQSWGDWVPNAPPIVPIRVAAPTGLGTFPTYAPAGWTGVTAAAFQEKWVVLLPGGYDPYGVVGKKIYLLDAYTGAKLFQTNDVTGIKQDFSFAALPAAVPWGGDKDKELLPGSSYNNGFFDTAIYGDTGGQVWVMRFNDVATFGANGLVNNWFFGRGFRQFAGDDTGASPYKMQHRTQFFAMASAARLDGGQLRAFLGSGDRANAAESGVGQCSIYNPLACGKQRCTFTLAENLGINGNPSVSGVNSYSGADNTATYSTSWSETFTSGTAACSPAFSEVNACVSCTGGGTAATVASPSEPQYACTNSSTGWKCSLIPISDTVAAQRLEAATVTPTPDPNGDAGYFNRFMAFNVFDNVAGRSRKFWRDQAGATTYDGLALTEALFSTAPGSVPAGSIANLFSPAKSFSAVGTTSLNAVVNANASGYYFNYPVLDERTATNTVVAQNCVSWYTMEPGQPCNADTDCTGGTCNTTTHTCTAPTACGAAATLIPARSAFLYQINATDGSTTCGLTSSSYIRTASALNAFLVPPPPPQQLVSQNSAGQLQFSIIAPAGQLSPPAAAGIGGAGVNFSFFYTIGTPRELELCRHQFQANACYP